jgi:hypothetical protein
MKTLLSIALIAGSFSLTACNTSTTAGDPYYSAWYNAYGVGCSANYGNPYPGCDYYQNGTKIQALQDPFWSQWKRGEYWTSPTGIWYDPSGYALNSDPVVNEAPTDVISAASAQETQMVHIAAKNLSGQYALSESSSIQITRSLNDWATLGRDRARTEADVADFAERLYGVSATKVSQALDLATQTHSLKPLEDLNVDVAAYWNTSPEVSKIILKKWYGGQLSL